MTGRSSSRSSPTATATGIILDERGQSHGERRGRLPNRYIRENDGRGHTRGAVHSDRVDGRAGPVRAPELLVGQEYEITVPAEKNGWYIAGLGQAAGGRPRSSWGRSRSGRGPVMWSFRVGKPAAGDPAPGFEAKTLDGRSIKLEDFRGKYVLLDFWATSCRPCTVEIPRPPGDPCVFGRDKRLVILSLSLDETIEIPRQFQEKQKLPWMQGFLGKGIDGAVPDRYGVRAVPAFVLVGPDGKIVAKGMRDEEIQQAVARALGGP